MERFSRRFKNRIVAAALAAGLIIMMPARPQDAPGSIPGRNWVATWSSAPMAPGSATLPATTFENQTVRQVVHLSVGGAHVRIRLSNAYGAASLVVGEAHVALPADAGSIVAGSDRTLTFNGHTSITIPKGALALSDPVTMSLPSLADLTVSIYVPNNTGPATYHESADQTGYISGPGNFSGVTTFPVSQTTTSRFWLSGVEVDPPVKVNAVVAIGDSIGEGFRSTVDANRRWTDDLSARANSPSFIPRLAVLNQAIGCSRLLTDICGPNGASRFDRDVLSLTGVTQVILALGLVDIVFATVTNDPSQAVSADQLITGLSQAIQRAHARGLKIIGATMTPNEGSTFPGFFTPANEAERQAVNQWIRTSGAYDGVIDFDAAVRDPSHPTRLLPAYASDDNTHLNDAGYAAMANAIDLSLFR
jgi:lysophospholipase L1-like esterase